MIANVHKRSHASHYRAVRDAPAAHESHPTGWRRFVCSTNHTDIGTMYLVFAIIAGVVGVVLSMMTRAELMQRYSSRSGLPMDEMDYYIVLGRFKMACVLEGGYARYVKGGADNPKMEAFGDVVLDMASRAALLAQTSKL